MRPLQISAISFLNTAPLMWDFEHQPSAELRNNFNIDYTVPSACADALAAGTADIGIIPVFTYAQIPNLVVVPDVAIASRGPVRSIVLVSKKPLEQVETVAADTSSRTSVALTQVLLTKWYGGKRDLVPTDPDLDKMLAACDAALIIGDPALIISEKISRPTRPRAVERGGWGSFNHAKFGDLHVFDLAELWVEKTGKPFVFAVWAVREQALQECKPGLDVAGIFQRSRDRGLTAQNIATIAKEWSPRLGLSEQVISDYLTENIYYKLDASCTDGLQKFFQYSRELGLIEDVPQMLFTSSARV
ncbi:MAG: menaquinone biosynthetic enzyme MqnA/MqnD family protein [Acidobacteriaceae bacterium]